MTVPGSTERKPSSEHGHGGVNGHAEHRQPLAKPGNVAANDMLKLRRQLSSTHNGPANDQGWGLGVPAMGPKIPASTARPNAHVHPSWKTAGKKVLTANSVSGSLSRNKISPEPDSGKGKQRVKSILKDNQEKSLFDAARPQRVRFKVEDKKTKKAEIGLSPAAVQRWLMLFVLPLSYELWAFPFRLALESTPSREGATAFCDMVCDFLFVLDGIRLIWLKVLGSSTREYGSGLAYFTKVFPYQLLPSIVFWILSFPECPLYIWWLATIPRFIPRAKRLYDFFRAMQTNLDVTVRSLQIVKFSLIIFLSSHWTGCFYYFIARVQIRLGEENVTWLHQRNTFLLFDDDASSTAEKYLMCLWRGTSGISNIGYHHLPSSTWPEMMFLIFQMFLSLYMQAFILGSMLHDLVQKDPRAEAFQQKITDVTLFCKQRALPLRLRKKLIQYFTFQHGKQNSAGAVKLPNSLEMKIARQLFLPTTEKNTKPGGLFFSCSQQFLEALVTKLREVFLMPGDEVIRTGQSALELSFVMHGTVHEMEGETIKRKIRGDTEMPSSLAELSFFYGIAQQYTLRAPDQSDVKLLVLSGQSAEEIFADFPDQREIVMHNILVSYNLDVNGKDLYEGGLDLDGDGVIDDADLGTTRELVRGAVKHRADETSIAVITAATEGDLEEVQRLLKRGMGVNACDWDKRTLLHRAAKNGRIKLVEYLLDQGADKDAVDRWGNSALFEAVMAKETATAELLLQWGAELKTGDEGLLVDSASQGEEEIVRTMLTGTSGNDGDYDLRSPLHVASAEGHDKVVELLVNHGVDVNCTDRWGLTPLSDALRSGHAQIATFLYDRGSRLKDEVCSQDLCAAASAGDVRRLQLMLQCGANPKIGDYDMRTAMHLAAAEGKLLAISLLLSKGAEPSPKDRWGATPQDDSVRGGSIFHWCCAKLISSMGGDFGLLKGTDEGARAEAILSEYSVANVRNKITRMIELGLDRRQPHMVIVPEVLTNLESCIAIIPQCIEMREFFDQCADAYAEDANDLEEGGNWIKSLCLQLATQIDALPKSSGTTQDSALESLQQYLRRMEETQDLAGFAEEESIVNDEVYALYEELDNIVAEQERREYQGSSGNARRAKKLQQMLLNVSSASDMLLSLIEICVRLGMNVFNSHAAELDRSQLTAVIHAFSPLLDAAEESKAVLDEMTEASDEASILFSAQKVELLQAVCHSPKFRKLLMAERSHVHSISTILSKSLLLESLAFKQIRIMSKCCEIQHYQEGDYIPIDGSGFWVLSSGNVWVPSRNVTFDTDISFLQSSAEARIVREGEMFGEFESLVGVNLKSKAKVRAKTIAVFVPRTCWSSILISKPTIALEVARKLSSSVKLQAQSSHRGRQDPVSHALPEESGSNCSGNQVIKSMLAAIFVHFAEISTDAVCDDPAYGGAEKRDLILPFAGWRGTVGVQAVKPQDRDFDELSTADLIKIVRSGLSVIDNCWQLFACGANFIEVEELSGCREHLGEVGSRFFDQVLLREFEGQRTVVMLQWWHCWMDYLSGENEQDDSPSASMDDKPHNDHAAHAFGASFSKLAEPVGRMMSAEDIEEFLQPSETDVDASTSAKIEAEKIAAAVENEHGVWYERFLPSLWRRSSIIPLLMNNTLKDVFEPSYRIILQDTTVPMRRDQVRSYLSVVLIDSDRKIGPRDIDDFMKVFGPQGESSNLVSWHDIRFVLEGGKQDLTGKVNLFIDGFGSAFNPFSLEFRAWFTLVQACSVFLFLEIPLRICFRTPTSQIDAWLALDLVVDIILFFTLVLNFNTSYRNSASLWVGDRAEIVSHHLSHSFLYDFAASVPMDWIIMGVGGDLHVADMLRLLKLATLTNLGRDARVGFFTLGSVGTSAKLLRMSIAIVALLHLCACVWYSLGVSTDDFTQGITWFRIDPNSQYIAQSPEYDLVYGTEASGSDSVPARYLLSLYHVCSTVTTYGNIGTLNPSNYAELAYTMFLIIINLTVFNYVIGEIGSSVMSGDEKLVEQREKLGAVESYLNGKDLPSELQDEVKRFYKQEQSDTVITMSDVFESLSYSLQLEVASCVSRDHLQKCDLFRNCSAQLLDNLRVVLRDQHFASEEYIYRQGSMAHAMYFILEGEVELMSRNLDGSESLERKKGPGSVVGDLESFFNMRYIWSCRVRAPRSVVCLRLLRSQLTQVLQNHQEDEPLIANNAVSNFEQARTIVAASRASKSRDGGNKHPEPDQAHEGSDESEEQTEEKTFGSVGHSMSEAPSSEMEEILGSEMTSKIDSLKRRWQVERVMYLCTYAARGELDQVKRVLSAGLPVNASDENGRSAVHVAASEGHSHVVEYLLDQGADPHQKDSIGHNVLTAAVMDEHDGLARTLLRYDAGLKLSLSESASAVRMCYAAFRGQTHLIERFLEFGVSVNAADYDKRTPLHLAVTGDNLPVVKLLVERKADLNVTDRFGNSPLYDAVTHDQQGACTELRRHGARLIGENIGGLLCEAAAAGNVERLHMLIENGADPNHGDYDARTCLHLAASNGQVPALNYLVSLPEGKIEMNPVDRMGGTPFDDAARHGWSVAKEMLRIKGGVSGEDEALRSNMAEIEEQRQQRLKSGRLGKVKDLAEASTETKAFVWVKGRYGKLVTQNLGHLIQAAQAMKDEWNAGAESGHRAPSTISSVSSPGFPRHLPSGASDGKRKSLLESLHAVANDIGKAQFEQVYDLLSELNKTAQASDAWLIMLRETQSVLNEPGPSGKAVEWAATRFGPVKKRLQRALYLLIALCHKLKFLSKQLSQLLADHHAPADHRPTLRPSSPNSPKARGSSETIVAVWAAARAKNRVLRNHKVESEIDPESARQKADSSATGENGAASTLVHITSTLPSPLASAEHEHLLPPAMAPPRPPRPLQPPANPETGMTSQDNSDPHQEMHRLPEEASEGESLIADPKNTVIKEDTLQDTVLSPATQTRIVGVDQGSINESPQQIISHNGLALPLDLEDFPASPLVLEHIQELADKLKVNSGPHMCPSNGF